MERTREMSGADLFTVAEARLRWLDQRQRVVSQNVANADTPGYRAHDLAPFAATLDGLALAPVATNPLHLAAFGGSTAATTPATTPSVSTRPVGDTARAPDGNDVDLEAELTRVADDQTAQALVGNLWKATMGLYMTALGKG